MSKRWTANVERWIDDGAKALRLFSGWPSSYVFCCLW
jgi:hypothetical protein